MLLDNSIPARLKEGISPVTRVQNVKITESTDERAYTTESFKSQFSPRARFAEAWSFIAPAGLSPRRRESALLALTKRKAASRDEIDETFAVTLWSTYRECSDYENGDSMLHAVGCKF